MLKSIVFVLLCSTLGACATIGDPSPAVISVPVQVKVPVPVPCITSVPNAPTFGDDKTLLAGSGAQVFDNVWADHLARRDYENKLTATLSACVGTAKIVPKAAK